MSDDKPTQVKRLFDLLGGQPMVEESMRRTLRAVSTQVPGDEDSDFWKDLDGVLIGDQTVAQAWLEALDRILDPDDLELLIGFYASPAGQKMAAAAPHIGDIAPKLLMEIDGMIKQRLTDLIQRARKSPAP